MLNFTPTKRELVNQKSIQKFIETYAHSDNWHNLNPSTGNLGYGLIHYANIRNLKPERILCIGSRYGFIPAICALACKDNRGGVVDFVDAGYDQNINEKNHWGGVGIWKKINKTDYFKSFDLSPFINLYVTTSKQYAQTYPKRTYKYIHLDGDHSYAGVKSDFRRFWPKLDSLGFMCLHDIYTQNLGNLTYDVHSFWQELQLRYHHTMEFPGACGLGILQKP